jgi:alpha-amylase
MWRTHGKVDVNALRGLAGLALAYGALCACARNNDLETGRSAVGPTASDGGTPAPDGAAVADPRAKSVAGAFVQLFEWPWPDVGKECTLYLGPKGFSAVQVSPPSEHAVLSGFPWYERYQTVGYELDRSRSGTKAEFVDMVQTCAAAGVDIYVDAVINHTTGQISGTGSNGTVFQKYQYPGLYDPTDFHQPTCQIVASDYTTSALHVQTCELEGLADLDTGADYVRTTLANYLISLIEIGVHGFRVDSAKHISSIDLDAILTQVASATPSFPTPFYLFEVEDPGGEVVVPSDYYGVGNASGVYPSVTEFLYGGIGDRFLNNSGLTLSNLQNFGPSTWGLIPSDRAIAFTNNHDTQRATAIFYQNEPYYDLANIFMLAWPYGYPSIMSGYAFDRSTAAGQDQGPLSDSQGNTLPIYPAGSSEPACVQPQSLATAPFGSWTCEHRVPSIAGMVSFRKATADVPTVTDWWDDGSNAIAFGRGALGFVVINRETSPLTRGFQTELKSGEYCDVIGGGLVAGTCSGATITVDAGGSAQITVPADGAVAIHVDAMLP